MSRIVIQDETAGVERLNWSDTRFFHIGSGTGIQRITFNGSSFADQSAILQTLRILGPSLDVTTGSVTVSDLGTFPTVNVSTYPGREPIVTADSVGSGYVWTFDGVFCNGPTDNGTPLVGHSVNVGSVDIYIQNVDDKDCPCGTAPGAHCTENFYVAGYVLL